MEKINSLSKKLYVARDIEGERNTEGIKVLRELEESFKKYEWFIGVSLMGSNVRGYNTKSSDVDCKMIFDSSTISRSEVVRIVKLNIQEIEKSHNFRLGHISFAYIAGFNTKKIEKSLQEKGGADYTDTLLTLKDLSGIVIGEMVDKYRTIVKEFLLNLESEQRERILNQIVDFCIQEEKLSEQKLSRRMEMSASEMVELWTSRRKLWKKRIDTVWT